jgi:hypothetical protein
LPLPLGSEAVGRACATARDVTAGKISKTSNDFFTLTLLQQLRFRPEAAS